jgi:hypothetical protein
VLSVYSLIAVPYNVLAVEECVVALRKLLKVHLGGLSNLPSRTRILHKIFGLPAQAVSVEKDNGWLVRPIKLIQC